MITPEKSGPDTATAVPASGAQPLPDGLLWRALTYVDIPRWLRLVQRIAAVDEPDWVEQKADLEQALRNSKNDPRRDTLAGFDADGEIRAFGRVSLNPGSTLVHGAGGVDPEHRGRGLGRAV